MNKIRFRFVLALALSLGLAACGAGNPDDPEVWDPGAQGAGRPDTTEAGRAQEDPAAEIMQGAGYGPTQDTITPPTQVRTISPEDTARAPR